MRHETLYGMLQVEERLLGHAGRREKYIANCLLGTPEADLQKVFKQFSPNVGRYDFGLQALGFLMVGISLGLQAFKSRRSTTIDNDCQV